MRGLLVLVAIVVLVAAVAIWTGWLPVWQTRPAVVQAPSFQAELPKVSLGNKTVEVPTISVQKPGDQPTPAPTTAPQN